MVYDRLLCRWKGPSNSWPSVHLCCPAIFFFWAESRHVILSPQSGTGTVFARPENHLSCDREYWREKCDIRLKKFEQPLTVMRVMLATIVVRDKRLKIFLKSTNFWRRCECRYVTVLARNAIEFFWMQPSFGEGASAAGHDVGAKKAIEIAFSFPHHTSSQFCKARRCGRVAQAIFKESWTLLLLVSRRARALVCLQRKTSKKDNGRAHWRHRAVEAFSPSSGLSEVFHILPRSRSIA